MLRLRAKKLPLTVQGSYTSKNVERIQNCGTEDSIIELLLGGYAFCHSIVCNIMETYKRLYLRKCSCRKHNRPPEAQRTDNHRCKWWPRWLLITALSSVLWFCLWWEHCWEQIVVFVFQPLLKFQSCLRLLHPSFTLFYTVLCQSADQYK